MIFRDYLDFLLFQSNFCPLNVNSTGFDFQFNLNSQSIFIILSLIFEKVNKTGESCFNDLSKSQHKGQLISKRNCRASKLRILKLNGMHHTFGFGRIFIQLPERQNHRATASS